MQARQQGEHAGRGAGNRRSFAGVWPVRDGEWMCKLEEGFSGHFVVERQVIKRGLQPEQVWSSS